MYFRIDRKRKLPITTFLFALGYSRKEILETFYDFKNFTFIQEKKLWSTKFNANDYKRPIKLRTDLINPKDEKIVLKLLKPTCPLTFSSSLTTSQDSASQASDDVY